MRSQVVTSKGRGGRRTLPYAFTEQGVAMLSSVLRGDRAVRVNIEIMRAFVRLRQVLSSHAQLSRKLDALEQKYDAQFRGVFDAIRGLMTPPTAPRKGIGSGTIGLDRHARLPADLPLQRQVASRPEDHPAEPPSVSATSASTVFQLRTVLVVASFASKYWLVSLVRARPLGQWR